jgi:hypothetical protein
MRPAILLCAGLALHSQEATLPGASTLLGRVRAESIQAHVSRLVAFGTRHTLSDPTSPTRGIGAARAWLGETCNQMARAHGSRLQAFEDRFTAPVGPRIPRPVELVNVGVVLPGTDPTRAKEAIVLTGHYDSRASDVMDATSDAPGAVDDGSGTAMILEMAQAVMRADLPVTIYFVAVAGEEQGLVGSAHLARRLKEEGVKVLAMVSIDIAGNTEGQDGVKDNVSARLFSEGVSTVETEAQRKLREAVGGENDGAAREWARYVKRVAERHVENLDLRLMLRRDRLGRGSDHTAFSREGFPALRLSETHEHYDRQHQDVRVKEGRAYGDDLAHFDADYAAKLARGLLAATVALAGAPAAPEEVTLGGAVSPDTKLRWKLRDPRATGVVLYRRQADQLHWQRMIRLPRQESLVLPNVPPDNETFAVASIDAEGRESLPTYPSRLE